MGGLVNGIKATQHEAGVIMVDFLPGARRSVDQGAVEKGAIFNLIVECIVQCLQTILEKIFPFCLLAYPD